MITTELQAVQLFFDTPKGPRWCCELRVICDDAGLISIEEYDPTTRTWSTQTVSEEWSS